jgi:hypothetical protein
MYRILAETWEWELSRAKVTEIVGAERARDLFVVESPHDRVIVGDAPAAPAKPAAALRKAARAATPQSDEARVLASAATALEAAPRDFELRAGSNNWE